MKLGDYEQAALAKAVTAEEFKQASSQLTPGKYAVNVFVHVRGELTKGDDYTQEREPSADWKRLAYKALSKLNETTLEAIVREHFVVHDDELAVFEERVKPIVKQLGQKKTVECSGAVRAKLVVDKVPTGQVQLPTTVAVTYESGAPRRTSVRSKVKA